MYLTKYRFYRRSDCAVHTPHQSPNGSLEK